MGWTVLVPAVVVLVLDQSGKRLATGAVNGRGALVPLSPPVALLLWAAVVAWVAAFVAAGPALPALGALGLGLCLGGAASNLGDRLIRGGVIDHLSIGRWPTFNVADAALTAGAILAAGSLL